MGQGVGVDVVVLVDMADIIYDHDHGGHSSVSGMTFEKFIDLILNMRGKNTATVQDLKQQQRLFKVMMTDTLSRMQAAVQEGGKGLQVELQEIRARMKEDDSSDGERDDAVVPREEDEDEE